MNAIPSPVPSPAPNRHEGGPPVALTVAGSDSGGGAGIQADLKTFQAFGVYGTTALTSVTAQDTRGVHAVHPVPPEMVRAQMMAVIEDLRPRSVKTGMLGTREVVEVVADVLATAEIGSFVLDPVMVATSGDPLIQPEAIRALRGELLPLSTLVTPNLDEAEMLTGVEVRDEAGMTAAGQLLLDAGAGAVLVKGGHLAGGALVDVLVTPAGVRRWTTTRIETRSTHGTGCTLSAACAAGLAKGLGLEDAVGAALSYVRRAIASAPSLGSGHGPLNHLPDAGGPSPE